MNNAASRNMYKLTSKTGEFLAHITAANSLGATGTYRDITGFRGEVRCEQISHGYPEHVVQISK
jgi:hypothetical protein